MALVSILQSRAAARFAHMRHSAIFETLPSFSTQSVKGDLSPPLWRVCSALDTRPSARLTALQYSHDEPRWIPDLDQGKKNSLPRSAPQCERSEKIPPDYTKMPDRSRAPTPTRLLKQRVAN
jgi:hypothetical protein